MNGPNAEIVDQIFEGAVPAPSKRSRPTSVSSLDYQVRAKRDQLTTTKPGKRKTQQQQQQQPDHHQQYRRSISTRARGSSGPPPRRFDLSDLEGMDEDQLLQALYEDPQLADAAAKAAEKAKKQKRSTRKFSSPTTPPKDQYYRAADGSVKDVGQYPEHLREMIDGGVPVTQWIVLLVLLCAGLYQLRKAVLGPAATAVSTSRVKTRSAGKEKTKTSTNNRRRSKRR